MKRILVLIALITQLVLSGAALATVNVDFRDTPFTDITTPASLTLDGITFSYDNGGSLTDLAHANSAGISGSTLGTLGFLFSAPATALNFDFSVQGVSGDVTDALTAIFDNGGVVFENAIFSPSLGEASGSLAYSSGLGPFSNASLIFSPVDEINNPFLFTVSNISYEPAAASVPEPATLLLLAAGLFGLGASRRFMRKQGCNHFALSEMP